MRVPLTIVPFVDPRSTTTKFWRFGRISAWRRLTFWSLSGMVHSDRRPTVTGVSPSGDPLARRQHERGGAGRRRRRRDWRSVARTSKRPGFCVSSTDSSTFTGPEEVVALAAGVLAGRLDELGLEHVGDLGEALEVLRRELDDEVVRDDPSPLDVDGTLVVHLAHEPPTELDRADVGS